MTWTQVYSPVNGSLLASALVAAIPVVVLLGLLALFHVRAHWAALLGLATALAIAVLVYGMPAKLALAAAVDGAAFGLLPIGWIILGAIFVYDVTVKSGDFEVLKHTIAGLASDRRIQLLLIGFSFGAFIEGAAGFGTPVAICGAMLIGLGFKPLQAAEAAARPEHSPKTAFKALVPWLLLCVFVFLWGYPASKSFLNGGAEGHENFLHGISVLNLPVPGLDKAVVRMPQVVKEPTPEAAVYTFN